MSENIEKTQSLNENTKIEKAHNINGIIISEYQLGKIYKIYSPQTDKIYIGSTIYDLSQRFKNHLLGTKKFNEGVKGIKVTSSYQLLSKYKDCKIMLIENYPCNTRRELLEREAYHIQLNKHICVNKNMPMTMNKKYSKKYLEKLEQNKEKILCICGANIARWSIASHEETKKHKNRIKKMLIDNGTQETIFANDANDGIMEKIPLNGEIDDLVERIDAYHAEKLLMKNKKKNEQEMKIDTNNINSFLMNYCIEDIDDLDTDDSDTEYTYDSNEDDSDEDDSNEDDSNEDDSDEDVSNKNGSDEDDSSDLDKEDSDTYDSDIEYFRTKNNNLNKDLDNLPLNNNKIEVDYSEVQIDDEKDDLVEIIDKYLASVNNKGSNI